MAAAPTVMVVSALGAKDGETGAAASPVERVMLLDGAAPELLCEVPHWKSSGASGTLGLGFGGASAGAGEGDGLGAAGAGEGEGEACSAWTAGLGAMQARLRGTTVAETEEERSSVGSKVAENFMVVDLHFKRA